MDFRQRDARDPAPGDVSPGRLIDALDNDDAVELDRIRAALAASEERALLDLAKNAEREAVERGDGEGTVDRLRNVVQSILLHRLLRRRKSA